MAHKKKGSLQSTMQGVPSVSTSGTSGSTMDHNICPQFSKPRTRGAGEPEVFMTGVHGKSYHGKETGANILSSPMGGQTNAAKGKK